MLIQNDICQVSLRQTPEEENDQKRVFIEALISSGEQDSHGTILTEKTLQNFAEDLNTQIQFKDSHRQGQGFGVSTGGRYEGGNVYGDFKLVRGWPLNDASFASSDTFIDAIDEGVITRVSVGFTGGIYICNICDSEWFRSSCYHWPKRKYEVFDEDGNSEMKTCIVSIDDARLIEVSAVARGSNPDAMIVEKAHRCLEHGCLPMEVQHELEDRYEMRFDASSNQFRGIDMDNTDTLKKDLENVTQERDALTKERNELKGQVTELEPLAACGKEARSMMAKEALTAYKKSRGENVNEKDVDRITKRFASLPFADLVDERNHYESVSPEPPKVESGSKTEQPDNSGREQEPAETKVRGINPSYWAGLEDA